jgi:tetratricopeptide (TPR) repeat protein
MADCLHDIGRHEEASKQFVAAHDLYNEYGARELAGTAALNAGAELMEISEYYGALAALERAAAHFQILGDSANLAKCIGNIGACRQHL